jgi:DHA1 family bicyclomycin/chloramphenicol resistance-like MFS transporter
MCQDADRVRSLSPFAMTLILGLLSGIGPFSTDLYLASMPDIGASLQATPAQVQLTISFYLVGFALGQIVYGPVSDRYGRKPVLLAAVTIYCIASIACVFATSIEMLIVARLLQALGGCGAIVLPRAIVRDLYSGARAGREMAVIAMVMGLAPLLAPILGGVLQTWFGWRSSFIVMAVVGIEAVALVWWYLPETLKNPLGDMVTPASILQSYRFVLREPSFVAHLLLTALAYAGLFAWISGAAFVLQDIYHFTALGFAVAFTLASAFFLAGTSTAAKLVMRYGVGTIIGAGSVLLAVGGLSMVAVLALRLDHPFALVGAAAIYIAGLGLMLPQAIAAAINPFPERAGAASSLIGFVQQLAASLCGVLVGHQLGVSAWPIAIPMALGGCATLACWSLTRGVRAPRH